MSGYTLESGRTSQRTTRSCAICLRRYPATPEGCRLWRNVVRCDVQSHTHTYNGMAQRINAWAERYSSLTGEYVTAHLDDLPADCHLPVQRGAS